MAGGISLFSRKKSPPDAPAAESATTANAPPAPSDAVVDEFSTFDGGNSGVHYEDSFQTGFGEEAHDDFSSATGTNAAAGLPSNAAGITANDFGDTHLPKDNQSEFDQDIPLKDYGDSKQAVQSAVGNTTAMVVPPKDDGHGGKLFQSRDATIATHASPKNGFSVPTNTMVPKDNDNSILNGGKDPPAEAAGAHRSPQRDESRKSTDEHSTNAPQFPESPGGNGVDSSEVGIDATNSIDDAFNSSPDIRPEAGGKYSSEHEPSSPKNLVKQFEGSAGIQAPSPKGRSSHSSPGEERNNPEHCQDQPGASSPNTTRPSPPTEASAWTPQEVAAVTPHAGSNQETLQSLPMENADMMDELSISGFDETSSAHFRPEEEKSFEDLFSEFLVDLQENKDMNEIAEKDLIDLNVQLETAISIGYQCLDELMDLVENLEGVDKSVNRSIRGWEEFLERDK